MDKRDDANGSDRGPRERELCSSRHSKSSGAGFGEGGEGLNEKIWWEEGKRRLLGGDADLSDNLDHQLSFDLTIYALVGRQPQRW